MLLLFICHSTSTITDIQQQYYRVTMKKPEQLQQQKYQSTLISQSCCSCCCWYAIFLLLLWFNSNCAATLAHIEEQKYKIKKALLTTCVANHILYNRCGLGPKSFSLYIAFPICDYHSCVLNLLPHAITIYLLFVTKESFFP